MKKRTSKLFTANVNLRICILSSVRLEPNIFYILRLLLIRMHVMRIKYILFFTLTTTEGHHFAFTENILCYTSNTTATYCVNTMHYKNTFLIHVTIC